MTLDTETNPCCKKKGTLVITIEPCTKGRETRPEKSSSYTGERFVPGLPRKTARTMEIEVKIKGKDQELFSDEELSPVLSVEEYVEETELVTHSPPTEGEEEVEEKSSGKISSEESVKSDPNKTISCRTIPLEVKPCAKTCPGPLICLPKKHFFGDNCKLHDPTLIGHQILEMHKNGLIQKRLYTAERIYPPHILSAISEINKRQTEGAPEELPKSSSGDKGDVVEEVLVKKAVNALKETKEDVPRASVQAKEEQVKRNRSGCFC